MRTYLTGLALYCLALASPWHAQATEDHTSDRARVRAEFEDCAQCTRRLVRWECVARPRFGTDVTYTGYSQYFTLGTGQDEEARFYASRMASRHCRRLTRLRCVSVPERDCRLL